VVDRSPRRHDSKQTRKRLKCQSKFLNFSKCADRKVNRFLIIFFLQRRKLYLNMKLTIS
jgi:hypothetical protein